MLQNKDKNGREFANKKWMKVEKGHQFLVLAVVVTINRDKEEAAKRKK